MKIFSTLITNVMEDTTKIKNSKNMDVKKTIDSEVESQFNKEIVHFRKLGFELNNSEKKEIKNFVLNGSGEKDEKRNAIFVALTRKIEIDFDKLEAINIAISGTSVEESNALQKIFWDMKKNNDEDYDSIKNILAQTLTNTTIKLMSKGMDLRLKYNSFKNYNSSYSYHTSDGLYVQLKSHEKIYTYTEYKGNFKDLEGDDKISYLIEKNARSEKLTESEMSYLKLELNNRYSDELDNILNDMDTFEFKKLIDNAITGSDGEVREKDRDKLKLILDDIDSFKENYNKFTSELTSWNLSLQENFKTFEKSGHKHKINNDISKLLSQKIHDYILSEGKVSRLKLSSEIRLQELKQCSDRISVSIDDMDYNKTKNELKKFDNILFTLSDEGFRNTELTKNSLKHSYGINYFNARLYSVNARSVFNLLENANIGLNFSQKPDKITKWHSYYKSKSINVPGQREIHSNIFRYSKIDEIDSNANIKTRLDTCKKTDFELLARHRKRIYGYQLLNSNPINNSIRELFIGMSPSEFHKFSILNFYFRQFHSEEILSFKNFNLNLKIFFEDYGVTEFDFSASNYDLNLNVKCENPNFIKQIRKHERSYTTDLSNLGFKKITTSSSIDRVSINYEGLPPHSYLDNVEKNTFSSNQVSV